MSATTDQLDIETSTDVDALWSAFLKARADGDDERAEAIQRRMGVVQEQRQLDHLDDDQLLAKIANLEAVVSDEDIVSSDGSGQVGELSALLDEAARRGL